MTAPQVAGRRPLRGGALPPAGTGRGALRHLHGRRAAAAPAHRGDGAAPRPTWACSRPGDQWLAAAGQAGRAWRRPASPRVFISIDSEDAAVHEKNRGLKGVCERIRGANARAGRARHHAHRLRRDEPPRQRLPGAGALPAGAGLRRRHLLLSAQGAARLLLARLVGGQRPGGPLARPSCWPPSTRWTRCATSSRSTTRAPPSPTCGAGCAARRSGSTASPATSTSTSTGTTTSGAARTGSEPLCPVWEFEPGKTVRDGCQACTTDCYRDASVMLHFAVALGDAFARLSEGRPVAAAAALADRPQRRLAGRGDRPRQPPRAARRRGLTDARAPGCLSAARRGGDQPRRGLKYCPPTR